MNIDITTEGVQDFGRWTTTIVEKQIDYDFGWKETSVVKKTFYNK